jgi:NAD(P) transhydrogenase subunit alpha
MIAGIVKETFPGEKRVALVPAAISALTKAGWGVLVEREAGMAAGFLDHAYERAGARLAANREEVFSTADCMLQVRLLGANLERGITDLGLLRPGQVLIGFADPLSAPAAAQQLAAREVTVFAMELVPRISRAQPMDALSSMANVAGYKAVLLAAAALPRFFPLLMTAAGTVSPAKVLVLGAGVAGLQAIATARRLGAVVAAYDVRPAVKQEVESLGARFLELPLETAGAQDQQGYARAFDEAFYRRQRELLTEAVAAHDVVITTAAVPGKRAPLLITAEMVRGMQPGSIIVDLAAERGGNCELTQADATVSVDQVVIMGPTNLPATVAWHASQLYARNISSLLLHLAPKGQFAYDLDDPITRDVLVARGGQVVHPAVRALLEAPSAELK